MEAIEARFDGRKGGEAVIQQAQKVKTRLEQFRADMRDAKRTAVSSYLMNLDKESIQDLYRDAIGDPAELTKRQMADAMSVEQYPDDWGIENYMPHLFFGQWKVTAQVPGVEGSKFVIRARTPFEAKARIRRMAKENPEMANAEYTVDRDTMITPDMIRLGDRNFWRLISEMKAQSLREVNPREALAGIIGRKAGRQKSFGSLLHRTGAKNFTKNYREAMRAYISGFHRWQELSAMNREVAPLIEQVRAQGRRNAADRLETILDTLWGKPTWMTREFDAAIEQVPGLRDYIKPLALDRWSRNLRQVMSMLTLTTLRFSVINRLQPLQGLYPLVGERLFIKAKAMQHSEEGAKLLDEAGVRFDPGQYHETGSRISHFRERFSGETSNREFAFLALYLHGLEKGMARQEAINYGKLRGQLMTQFTPLITDKAPVMSGPIGEVVFQYRRFPAKQMELIAQMAKEKKVSGLARMMMMYALLGGASFFLKQAFQDERKKKRIRDAAVEEFGEGGADFVMYGLPGLMGADFSGTLVLADEPYGRNFYEKVGRTLTGPSVGTTLDMVEMLNSEERESQSASEKARTVLRRIPSLRPLAELGSIVEEDYDVLSPDGEVRYRKSLRDTIMGLGAFRTANESNLRTAENALFEVKKQEALLKNRYWVAYSGGEGLEEALQAIEDFNAAWPEAYITDSDLARYVRYRQRRQGQTSLERSANQELQEAFAP